MPTAWFWSFSGKQFAVARTCAPLIPHFGIHKLAGVGVYTPDPGVFDFNHWAGGVRRFLTVM